MSRSRMAAVMANVFGRAGDNAGRVRWRIESGSRRGWRCGVDVFEYGDERADVGADGVGEKPRKEL
jgi:hypothetical protein